MPVELVVPIDLAMYFEVEDVVEHPVVEDFVELEQRQEHLVGQLVKPIELDSDRFHWLLVDEVLGLQVVLVPVEGSGLVERVELVLIRWWLCWACLLRPH